MECGLINIKQQGRERICEARLEKLNEVAEWIEQYKVFWTSKLDALETFLAKDAEESITSQSPSTPNVKSAKIKTKSKNQ